MTHDDQRDSEDGAGGFELPLRSVRQPAGINLFKLMVLGDAHVPADHQHKLVLEEFVAAGLAGALDRRTWQSWFGKDARQARAYGVTALDRYVDVLTDPRRADFQDSDPASTFFRDLILGGLPSRLQAPTKSKQPLVAMLERTIDYAPQSPIHLHLDAIEAAGMTDGNGAISWEQMKELTGACVLGALNTRWSPRRGTVYANLTSRLEQRLQAAGAEERTRIREAYAKYKPDRFETYLKAAPQPKWADMGVTEDFCTDHVYKALFLLSLDQEFLVADRFEAWALDLASAAFAMHAVAWSDRHLTHGPRTTPESVYWRAFDQIFFQSEDDAYFCRVCIAAFELEKASWDEGALLLLKGAGIWYQAHLRQLGLEPAEVSRIVRRCWQQRHQVYRGG